MLIRGFTAAHKINQIIMIFDMLFTGWCCEAALLKPSTHGLHRLSGWHCQGMGLKEWPMCEGVAWPLGSDPRHSRI